MEALEDAERYTRLTLGRFDVTVGGLLSSLGFHGDERTTRNISDRELADAKEGIGWHHVRLESNGRACRMHAATQIDLGGIGAGIAVDRMGSILRQHGVEAALIDHSGDLLAIGAPPDADGWSVAIPGPPGTGEYPQLISLRDRAISTSTNTMSTRNVGGRTVGHILEPNTGQNPRDLLSVSVLAPNSTEADALSTALFVHMDPEGPWRNGEREAIVIRPDGLEHTIVRLH
jgi:thiamine biosynthesis lipoprotein